MEARRKALVLIGSPKPGPSASLVLGAALAERLAKRGYSVETTRIVKALRTTEATQTMLEQLDTADVVVLATPLYADSLPAPVVRALELSAERRSRRSVDDRGGPIRGSQRFVGIVNCGFPESEQCATALEICRLFAREAGFVWAGGLARGMGGSVAGRPLERGPHARSAAPALDLVAAALARGEDVPREAVELMSKHAMPAWSYQTMGNLGWHMQARGKTGGRSLRYRPYATASPPAATAHDLP